ncbi:MAG: neutral/alkaline non-lysosomal ceramidase N-terminal domain-containing protein [Acidobacteria bacterium]|nr:neutral/alkaline non-lysosomal ceramidase N-terminal domain-containing protein [Acidobacteriota bacterium]
MKLALLLALTTAGAFAQFRAGVAKVDITPKDSQWLMGYAARQSTGIHDPIFHRVVVLDDGTTQFYLISSDVCVFSPTVYDDVARELKQKAGIDLLHVWWTATHTHSAPEVGPPDMYDILLKGRSDHAWSREYLALIKEKLYEGVRAAKANLRPARLGAGVGASTANINRRARDVDGRISLGLNPDGPVDRQIGLIRLENTDGSLLALIANYAMHGTVMGGRWMQISGDGPGVVADYVEKRLGAPMLYINGAAGNIAPIYSVYDTPRAGHLTQFNVMLGDRIIETAKQTAASVTSVKLAASEKVIETARKPGLTWSTALEKFASQSASGAPMVRIPVRFLRINDVMLWAAPVELFCEIAIRVRNESPYRHTFYYGYSNGWIGYLPTAAGFREGGYEPTTSPFTESAEGDLTRGVLMHIQGMPR